MTNPDPSAFQDAMRYCFLSVFVAAFAIVGFLDWVKTSSRNWYAMQCGHSPHQPRPWYVRFYEFTQQR